jgi:hypothetical protein
MFYEDLRWHSPHQSNAYAEVEAALGDREHVVLLDVDSNPVHFYGKPSEAMVAWEVGPHVQIGTLYSPEKSSRDYIAYAYVKRKMNDDIASCSPESYITNFLLRSFSFRPLDEDFPVRVSKRMLRDVKIAQRMGYELQQPETPRQIKSILSLFAENPPTMGGHDVDTFGRIVKQTARTGFASLHALMLGSDICGASVVYHGDNHATLRYYTALRTNYAGHKLVYETVRACFADGCEVVDMSGVPHPAKSSTDPKLQGIYQFKKHFSMNFAEFKPIHIASSDSS